MLRITMLKLKRAWSLALTLRNRGDTGKFHRLMTVRTAQKSTKPDKDNEWKYKKIIDYLFSPLRTQNEIRRIQSILLNDIKRLQRAVKKQQREQKRQKTDHQICPKAQCEKCNKLIAAIFGEDKRLDSKKVSDTKKPEEVERVLSTTARQIEDQLLQKIEVINETPLVEAEKTPVAGFNTNPRVLGHDLEHSPDGDIDGDTALIKANVQKRYRKMVRRLENSEMLSKVRSITYGVVNFSNFSTNSGSGGDKQDEYDSIAKRNLNIPSNELDNRLIKEMQQLGVPKSSGNSTLDVQMGAPKKTPKPSSKTEIELEARKCDNEPPTDDHQTADSGKGTHSRTLQAAPNLTFASRLHEEGIRYTEQTTSNEENKKKKIVRKLEKRQIIDKPMLQSQNITEKTNNIKDKQNAVTLHGVDSKEQPLISALPVLKVPQHLKPWSTKLPYFQDPATRNQLSHPEAYLNEKKSSYDPHKPIIDPHDKKNIASDTDTYGYEPLRANATEQNKNFEKSLTIESKKSVDQPLIPIQQNVTPSPESYLTLKDQTTNFKEQNKSDVKCPTTESEKTADNLADSQSSIANQTPGSYRELAFQAMQSKQFNRDMPYYYNQNIAYRGQFPNQQNLWPNSKYLEHLKGQTENDTERYKNAENLQTTEPERSENQSCIANQTLGSYTETTFQGMYLNRDMPYYYNEYVSYGRQYPDQHFFWSSSGSYKHFKGQTANDTAQNKHEEKIETKEPEKLGNQSLTTIRTPGSYPEKTFQGMYLNRDMPYYCNEYVTYREQFPNQTNVWSSSESYKHFKDQTTNDAEQNKNEEKSQTTEPEKSGDQSLIANQISGSYPGKAFQRMEFDRDKPYYYNQNIAYYAQFPNKRYVWSGSEGYEHLKDQTANYTEQNKNKEILQATEPETSGNQSSTANQTLGPNPKMAFHGMHFNGDMPSYSNQNIAFRGQFPNQQNVWSNSEIYEHVQEQSANATKQNINIEKLQTTEPEKSGVQSSIANQTPASYPEMAYQGIYLNRDIPYYYNQNTYPDQFSNQQYNWLSSKGYVYPFSYHTANVREQNKHDSDKSNTTDPQQTADQSSMTNQTKESNSEVTYQEMHLNRDMPYYYNPHYTHPGQFPWSSQALSQNIPENTDNIIRDQHTGDPSYKQDSQDSPMSRSPDQRHAWTYPYQQQGQEPQENVASDANPDKNCLDQHTGDPSYEQVSQENITRTLNPCQNPNQYIQQGQASRENMPADTNQDNIFLHQHTGDPSYEEVSQDHWMNNQYPYFHDTRVGQVEQLHSSLYTADPYYTGQPGNLKFSNYPYELNYWNQYPYYMNTMRNVDRIPPYENQQTTSKQTESKEVAIETWTNQTPESNSMVTAQTWMNPNLQPFHQPTGSVAQNPYFYHQSYTYYGKFPLQHNPLRNQHSPQGQMTEFNQEQQFPAYQETSEASDKVTNVHPKPKKPIIQPPAGPSVAFISLPQEKWNAATLSKPSPKESYLPDEKYQVDSAETLNPISEVDIPIPKDKNIPLSVLLRRVRQRSRQEYIARWTKVDPFEGKCGRERPPCPPPQPECPKPAPTPPPPCPPPPPACPRPCKPKCPPPCTPPTPGCPPPSPPCPMPKCPCCKFEAISLGDTLYNIFTLIWDVGSSIFIHRRPFAGGCCLGQPKGHVARPTTEDVGTQLERIGNNLLTTYGSDLGTYCWKLETLALSRGFEPWVPIPCWPLPRKYKEKPFVCPKEGCKQRPPPRYGDPCERPCYPGNPCLGFPNKFRKH